MKRWSLLLLALGCAQASELSDLQYLSEEYRPYNFSDEQGQPTGMSVELLQAVWKRTNTPPQRITIMPWARGYYLLTQKPNVVLFATARTAAREPLFKWACPIGYAEIVLLAIKDKGPALKSLDDAKQYPIAAVRADVGEQLLLNKGFDEGKILGANRLQQALKMLTSGRATLLSTNRTTVMELIHNQRLNPDQFTVAWVLSSEQFCYAFSYQVSDDLIKRFQTGLNQVLASNDYGPIRDKYFPTKP